MQTSPFDSFDSWARAASRAQSTLDGGRAVPVVVGRDGLFTCEAPTTGVMVGGNVTTPLVDEQSLPVRGSCHVYRSMEHAYPSCMLPPRADEPNAVADPDDTDDRAAGLYYPEPPVATTAKSPVATESSRCFFTKFREQ